VQAGPPTATHAGAVIPGELAAMWKAEELLSMVAEAGDPLVAALMELERDAAGRGLHSSPSQLNLSRF
jgi:hypothetical protein